MSSAAPMPAADTSWGPATFYDIGQEPDEDGTMRDVRQYMGSGWTVCCMRHGKTTDVWDEDEAIARVASDPYRWCEGCEAELGDWLRARPTAGTDEDAERRRELAGAQSRHDEDRELDRGGRR